MGETASSQNVLQLWKHVPHVRGAESCPAFRRKYYVCQQTNQFAKYCSKKGNYYEDGLNNNNNNNS